MTVAEALDWAVSPGGVSERTQEQIRLGHSQAEQALDGESQHGPARADELLPSRLPQLNQLSSPGGSAIPLP